MSSVLSDGNFDDCVDDDWEDDEFNDAPVDSDSVADGYFSAPPNNFPRSIGDNRARDTLSVIPEESRISDPGTEARQPVSRPQSATSVRSSESITRFDSREFLNGTAALELVVQEQNKFEKETPFIQDDPRFNLSHFSKENSWEPSVYRPETPGVDEEGKQVLPSSNFTSPVVTQAPPQPAHSRINTLKVEESMTAPYSGSSQTALSPMTADSMIINKQMSTPQATETGKRMSRVSLQNRLEAKFSDVSAITTLSMMEEPERGGRSVRQNNIRPLPSIVQFDSPPSESVRGKETKEQREDKDKSVRNKGRDQTAQDELCGASPPYNMSVASKVSELDFSTVRKNLGRFDKNVQDEDDCLDFIARLRKERSCRKKVDFSASLSQFDSTLLRAAKTINGGHTNTRKIDNGLENSSVRPPFRQVQSDSAYGTSTSTSSDARKVNFSDTENKQPLSSSISGSGPQRERPSSSSMALGSVPPPPVPPVPHQNQKSETMAAVDRHRSFRSTTASAHSRSPERRSLTASSQFSNASGRSSPSAMSRSRSSSRSSQPSKQFDSQSLSSAVTSSTQNLAREFMSLDLTDNVLTFEQRRMYFGFVDCHQAFMLRLKVTNARSDDVVMDISLRKENKGFSIVDGGGRRILSGGESIHIPVEFRPDELARFGNCLFIRCTHQGIHKRYSIPLVGSGGCASVKVSSIPPMPVRRDGSYVQSVLDPTNFSINLENDGKRVAFVKFVLISPSGRTLTADFQPTDALVLQRKQRARVNVRVPPFALSQSERRSSSASTVSSASTSYKDAAPLYTLHVFWGEEIQRQRFRLMSRTAKQRSGDADTTVTVGGDFCGTFLGEEAYEPPHDYKISGLERSVFDRSLRCQLVHIACSRAAHRSSLHTVELSDLTLCGPLGTVHSADSTLNETLTRTVVYDAERTVHHPSSAR